VQLLAEISKVATTTWVTRREQAPLQRLAPLEILEPGGGVRMLGTQVARVPRLQLVGRLRPNVPSAAQLSAERRGRPRPWEDKTVGGQDRARTRPRVDAGWPGWVMVRERDGG
jgi:hypothetical protein